MGNPHALQRSHSRRNGCLWTSMVSIKRFSGLALLYGMVWYVLCNPWVNLWRATSSGVVYQRFIAQFRLRSVSFTTRWCVSHQFQKYLFRVLRGWKSKRGASETQPSTPLLAARTWRATWTSPIAVNLRPFKSKWIYKQWYGRIHWTPKCLFFFFCWVALTYHIWVSFSV